MIVPTVISPTVVCVDWSGARRPKGIWIAVVRDEDLVVSEAVTTREDAVARVIALPPPVLAGFDFSFGVPAWFAGQEGCTTLPEVWERAATHGERWLAPTPPFWRDRCTLAPEQRFRQCETRLRTAKSVFQLTGPGQVAAGSVRGMPLLRSLRRSGFAIWPFDAPAARTALEIYPSALRRAAPHHDRGSWTSDDERDAVVSARVLWDHRATIGRLPRATDPITCLEGDVWTPSVTAWL